MTVYGRQYLRKCLHGGFVNCRAEIEDSYKFIAVSFKPEEILHQLQFFSLMIVKTM